MAGLSDKGSDACKDLHDGEKHSQGVSLASPRDFGLLEFRGFIKDGHLSLLDELVHEGLLVENAEHCSCLVLPVLGNEGVGRLRDVADHDEEELEEARQQGDAE